MAVWRRSTGSLWKVRLCLPEASDTEVWGLVEVVRTFELRSLEVFGLVTSRVGLLPFLLTPLDLSPVGVITVVQPQLSPVNTHTHGLAPYIHTVMCNTTGL